MNVNVAMTPAKDCPLGCEIVYPLHGDQHMLWTIFEKSEDGIAARCTAPNVKDILIIPRLDAPVAVVTAKRPVYGSSFQHYTGTSNTSASSGNWTFNG